MSQSPTVLIIAFMVGTAVLSVGGVVLIGVYAGWKTAAIVAGLGCAISVYQGR